jgi:hypothetical protein
MVPGYARLTTPCGSLGYFELMFLLLGFAQRLLGLPLSREKGPTLPDGKFPRLKLSKTGA